MKGNHGKKHSNKKRPAHHRKPTPVHIPHGKNTPSTVVEGNLIILGRGGGVVKCDEYKDGVRILENNINMALHGDIVKAKVTGTIEGEPAGTIVEIVLRAKTEFTGTLIEKNGKTFLKPADPKMYTLISIAPEKISDSKIGDRVYGTLETWKDAHSYPEGKILRVLGVPGEHETEMQAIALERGFVEDFPEEVVEEAKAIEARGITKDDLKDRRDFRKVVTFTIDPYDAKDFDDAISVEKLPNGDVEIGIHIADVSHYVQLKTELDTEALERGTSVYLVDRTIPMLPRALSDDLCSLLPNVDRLTMSAVITFGPDGAEKDAWFGPTIIHSVQRFTYESAQEVLDGAEHQYKEKLTTAARIARGLGIERAENGALVLDQEEVKVIIDDNGVPIKVVKKIRTESHTLIEELMLLANRRIAEFLERGGLPASGGAKGDQGKGKAQPHKHSGKKEKGSHEGDFSVIYRNHEQPSVEKTEDLEFFMRSIGHPIPVRKDGSLDPLALSKVVKSFEAGDLKQTALSFIIRSMSKAIYTTKNSGHYGLQFEHYTHFTSPIRRYPDLIIHRLLRYALAGKAAPASARKTYERVARLCSMAEVRAAEAERESVKFKLTEYMAARVGNVITGMITGVTEWGMYVRDKETTAEGLVSMRTMGTEGFTLNPRLATLTGGVSGKTYRIGDTILVKIVRADPERRQIDYEIVQA